MRLLEGAKRLEGGGAARYGLGAELAQSDLDCVEVLAIIAVDRPHSLGHCPLLGSRLGLPLAQDVDLLLVGQITVLEDTDDTPFHVCHGDTSRISPAAKYGAGRDDFNALGKHAVPSRVNH